MDGSIILTVQNFGVTSKRGWKQYVPKYVDNFVKNEGIKNPVEKPAFIQQAYQNAVNIFGNDKSLSEYAPKHICLSYQQYPQHITKNNKSF